MKYFRTSWLALLVIVAFAGILIGAAGCGGAPKDDFVTANIELSGESMTFQYPQSYSAPPNGPGDNAVTYRHLIGDAADLKADRMIFIETQPLNQDTTAASLMDQDLNTIMQGGPDFQLIKRTQTKIDGLNAELVAFTMTFPSGPLTSRTTTNWVAYVAHGDFVWQIGVMANADLGNAAETDFKNFSASFKFE